MPQIWTQLPLSRAIGPAGSGYGILRGSQPLGHGRIPQQGFQHVPMGRDDARRPPALRPQRIERRQAWRPATPQAPWRRTPHARAGQGTTPHALAKIGQGCAGNCASVTFCTQYKRSERPLGSRELMLTSKHNQKQNQPTQHQPTGASGCGELHTGAQFRERPEIQRGAIRKRNKHTCFDSNS